MTITLERQNTPAEVVYTANGKHYWDFTTVGFLLVSLFAVVFMFVLYPEYSVHFPRTANEFYSPGKLNEMESHLEEVLTVDPENINALVDLGITRYEMGPEHYVKALLNLEQARRLGSTDDRVFYYAAIMYEAQDLPSFAKQDYDRFLRNHPEDVEAQLRLANMLNRKGDREEALTRYERAYAIAPANPLVLYDVGIAYADMGMYEAARDALLKAERYGKTLPSLGNFRLGKVYWALGEREKALERYNAELAISPDYSPLHEMLAFAYDALNDKVNARASWKRVLALSPNNKTARQRLAELN